MSWGDTGMVMFNLIDFTGDEPNWQDIEDHIDIAQGRETRAQRIAKLEAERAARAASRAA